MRKEQVTDPRPDRVCRYCGKTKKNPCTNPAFVKLYCPKVLLTKGAYGHYTTISFTGNVVEKGCGEIELPILQITSTEIIFNGGNSITRMCLQTAIPL